MVDLGVRDLILQAADHRRNAVCRHELGENGRS
jgi:hypothetical protein